MMYICIMKQTMSQIRNIDTDNHLGQTREKYNVGDEIMIGDLTFYVKKIEKNISDAEPMDFHYDFLVSDKKIDFHEIETPKK